MRITMLETHRGSEDGFVVKQYIKDETYEVADTMGCTFVNNDWAVKRIEKPILRRELI